MEKMSEMERIEKLRAARKLVLEVTDSYPSKHPQVALLEEVHRLMLCALAPMYVKDALNIRNSRFSVNGL